MRNDFESNYLAHHGILGQKWGHKNGPPYPLDADKHSANEKKKGWMQSLRDKSEAKKAAKKKQAALEKARKTKEANKKKQQLKEEYEAKKKKVLESGKPSEVYKYQGAMSNEELRRALDRIDMERRLSDMANKETKTGHQKIADLMSKAKDYKDWANTGMEIYDTLATLHNFQNPDDQWRYMKKKNGGDEKKKKKDDD